MNLYDVIRRPLATEKNTDLMAMGKYAFEVAREANKVEIGKAVETIFSVKVTAVHTISVPAKERRRGRVIGYTKAWKKAIVTLAPGERIEIFEGV